MDKFNILKKKDTDYIIPISLDCESDEMGIMIGFNGEIEQINQICNFTYTQFNNILTLANSVNTENLKVIVNQTFTVDWGDGFIDNIGINEVLTHTYLNGKYEIKINFTSPWDNQKTSKIINIPEYTSISNPMGTFSGTSIPLDYLNDYDYVNYTDDTEIYFVAMGSSRVSELKQYGVNQYSGITVDFDDENCLYTGYTIDNLEYRDYIEGYTTITGSTTDFEKEELFNSMLTRNEYFLGFIDKPTVYSDIFVERGKLGVMEMNHRLGEIDNIGELSIYGNGFFTIKKQ